MIFFLFVISLHGSFVNEQVGAPWQQMGHRKVSLKGFQVKHFLIHAFNKATIHQEVFTSTIPPSQLKSLLWTLSLHTLHFSGCESAE